MKTWLVFLILFFVSCLDFEFQSPYEDLNGISIEHIRTYDAIMGDKLQIDNRRGYVRSWSRDTLSCYDFSEVLSISLISNYAYASDRRINDFSVEDGYAYIGVGAYPYYLEIIDFNQSQPVLVGSVEISNAYVVKLQGSYAYIAGSHNISVVDVHDKTNPEVVALHYFNRDIFGLELDTNNAYVLLDNSDFHILDISEPSQIHTVWSTSLKDTMGNAELFALNERYIYVAKRRSDIPHFLINVYHITDGPGLEYASTLDLPDQVIYLFTEDTLSLTSLHDFNTYLLNIKYPSLPCVSEILQKSAQYGIIEENYIYLFNPSLDIFEIKKVEQ